MKYESIFWCIFSARRYIWILCNTTKIKKKKQLLLLYWFARSFFSSVFPVSHVCIHARWSSSKIYPRGCCLNTYEVTVIWPNKTQRVVPIISIFISWMFLEVFKKINNVKVSHRKRQRNIPKYNVVSVKR